MLCVSSVSATEKYKAQNMAEYSNIQCVKIIGSMEVLLENILKGELIPLIPSAVR